MNTFAEDRKYISAWVAEMNKGMNSRAKGWKGWRDRGLAIDFDIFVEGQKGPAKSIQSKMPGHLNRMLTGMEYNPIRDELVLNISFSTGNWADFYTKAKIQKFSKRVKPERLIGHSWEEEYRFQNVRITTNNGVLEKMAGEGNHFFVNIRIFH